MSTDPDVIIVGAGAAGLAAAAQLGKGGLSVKIIEARDRIGGRIFTLRDPKHSAPIEMGAEFIHGLPPETMTLLKQRQVRIREVDGDRWCFVDGKLGTCDFFSDVERILSKMEDRNPDQSFLDFLGTAVRPLRLATASARKGSGPSAMSAASTQPIRL